MMEYMSASGEVIHVFGKPEYRARNEAIWRARHTGGTLAAVGKAHGLSIERVRQIVARADERHARYLKSQQLTVDTGTEIG